MKRQALKNVAGTFFAALVCLSVVKYKIGLRFFVTPDDRKRWFAACYQKWAKSTGFKGVYARRAFLRQAGCRVASDCHIEFGSLISSPDIEIASGAYVGAFCSLGSVSIGEKTMIADGVRIPSGPRSHGTNLNDVPLADQSGSPVHISIGKNCWIGANSVILTDVSDDAIVAAGAVVTESVAPGCMVGGVPARILKTPQQRQL